MFTRSSRHGTQPRRTAGARVRRLVGVLTASCGGVLAFATAPAFAMQVPVSEGGYSTIAPAPATTVRVVTTGGMPGWEITLIALGAALLAATAALLLDRARARRRIVSPASA
jgi:hypothetical protein